MADRQLDRTHPESADPGGRDPNYRRGRPWSILVETDRKLITVFSGEKRIFSNSDILF